MKKRKIKKKVIKIFWISVVSISILILSIIFITNKINYINSYTYKLDKIGYNKEEIKEIKKLDNIEIDDILKKEYNKLIVKFMQKDYFIYKNLDEYIIYYNENKDLSLKEVIVLINVKANNDFYDKKVITKTNINDNNLMLVNKYHQLDKNYSPTDLVDVKNYYSYGENKIKKEAYENFINMWTAAKNEDLSLIITSAYRDYNYQNNIWNSYADSKGDEWADSFAARAGFSEHQTGLAIDIVTYGSTMDNFKDSDEFKWLEQNCYDYGFILRYPKDKEKITGYSYEPWHYRYVGKQVAKIIKEKNITYDEYYAYYIEK